MSANRSKHATGGTLTSAQIGSFRDKGFVVAERSVTDQSIDVLLNRFVSLVNKISGERFVDAHSSEISDYLNLHKDIQSQVYDEIRKPDWLTDFSSQPSLVSAVAGLIGRNVGLLRKIPFRIDVPLETAQYAVWHQDNFYVRGNLEIVTAWIPLQDTVYLNGCLAVMPGSQLLGPIEHDIKVLSKRDYPSRIFDREVRYVEVKKGDVVLFHSCLLHSSSLNLSNGIRFSVQARYSALDLPTDPGMGGVIPLINDVTA
jgi:ectoine hydroxylase-related dioxygenase (phytanoyl-CoA dioxygenase family)